jgi:hypothetical protein
VSHRNVTAPSPWSQLYSQHEGLIDEVVDTGELRAVGGAERGRRTTTFVESLDALAAGALRGGTGTMSRVPDGRIGGVGPP